MKQILIVKDVLWGSEVGGGTITGINDMNNLVNGALVAFTENGNLINAANAAATFPDNKQVMFAVGTGSTTTGAHLSPYIDRESAIVNKRAYVAPVKQAILIGDDGALGLSLNPPTLTGPPQAAIIKVIDETSGTQPPVASRNWEEAVKVGDTMAAVMARLLAKINADLTNTLCVASDPSGVNTGMLLTAKNNNQKLSIALDGVLIDADKTVDGTGASTLIVYGNGTPDQIEALWQEYATRMGRGTRIWEANNYFSAVSGVDTAVNYDMYWIKWNQFAQNSVNSNLATQPELIIAIPTGAATITQANFETVLTQAFGVNSVNAESGT